MPFSDPFSKRTHKRVLRHVLIGTAVAAFVASLGAAVRLLPLALDPALPTTAFAPFARGVFALAIEVALLLGTSGGAASALFALTERGDTRALAALGESPLRTTTRALPAAAPFLLLLGVASFLFGRDAGTPGRVLGEIVQHGEGVCAEVEENQDGTASPRTVVLPFVKLAWLCAPGHAPRLAGRTPLGGVPLTARNLHVGGDLTTVTLDDARLRIAASGERPETAMHLGKLTISGLPPWGHALILPALARAILLPVVALLALLIVGYRLVLRPFTGEFARLLAIVLGLLPALAAFATLQILERISASLPLFYFGVPFVAVTVAALSYVPSLRRLRVRFSRYFPSDAA